MAPAGGADLDFPSPLAELPARLGWRLERDFYWDAEGRPDSLILRFAPDMPGVFATAGRDIVLDPHALYASARRPGGLDLLTCSCGIADDAGIQSPVFVSHPDAGTLVWELDIAGLGPALDEGWRGGAGYLRLIFKRQAYRASILDMVRAARAADGAPLPVEELEPDRRGDAWERLLELDRAETLWTPEPLLPPGSVLGVADDGRLWLDGQPWRGCPPRLFTRWAVYEAYQRDGEDLAERLRVAFAEGGVAPGVAVLRHRGD